MKASELEVLTLLAQGPGKRVCRARDPAGRELLLKTFSLAEAEGWKAQELFLREAAVLQQLDHPRLPRLLAFGEEDATAYLIYAFVPGESLAGKLAAGWRPAQAEVLDLARQLLSLLDWLHHRAPPIVHRDIKPSNLILAPDGALYLIDFGSVLRHLRPEGGSTLAGTYGYMAPEQLSGHALPASDLYGLGATLIHLLSGRSPAELPSERLWIRFEACVNCSPGLIAWLRTLIDPVPEERCPSAAAALASLAAIDDERQAPTALALPVVPVPPQPTTRRNSLARIRVDQAPGSLDLSLPPRAMHGPGLRNYVLTNSLSAGFFLVLTSQAYRQLGSLAPALQLPLLILMLSLAAAASLYEHRRLQRLTGAASFLRLSPGGLRCEEQLDARVIARHEIPWQALDGIEHEPASWLLPQGAVRLSYYAGGRPRRLRLARSLEPEEQAWLSGLLLARRSEAARKDAPQGQSPPEGDHPPTGM